MEKRKLLIVDDSALIRNAIRSAFEAEPGIIVAGEAANGKEALEVISEINPDVITLDINMPVMDGLRTLKNIMIRFPKPTIMCSTLTKEGAQTTFDALKFGALDFIHKPSRLKDMDLTIQNRDIVKKVTLAADVDMKKVVFMRRAQGNKKRQANSRPCRKILATGTSEGGYSSLLNFIPQLSPDLDAGLVVVLYSDPAHMDAFIHYLDRNSLVNVKRAVAGEVIQPGVCYITSGTEYTTVSPDIGNGYILNVEPSPFPDQQRAVNMLMLSLADTLKSNAAGIILSGGGEDGAEGMAEIFNVGGETIVQDPASCLCSDMARASITACRSHLVVAARVMADKVNKRFSMIYN